MPDNTLIKTFTLKITYLIFTFGKGLAKFKKMYLGNHTCIARTYDYKLSSICYRAKLKNYQVGERRNQIYIGSVLK